MFRIYLLIAVTISGCLSRHVYPFHYNGAMPDMVHMVDDPRQVGVEEPSIEPPRYGAKGRDLKTHDFYPHDPPDDDASYPTNGGIRGRLPFNGAVIPTASGNVAPPPTAFPQFPGVVYPQQQFIPVLPQFQPGPVVLTQSREQVPSQTNTQFVFPQQQTDGRLQCFAVGTLRNEAMDSWCVSNCNHTPSFCPPAFCACGAYKKKK